MPPAVCAHENSVAKRGGEKSLMISRVYENAAHRMRCRKLGMQEPGCSAVRAFVHPSAVGPRIHGGGGIVVDGHRSDEYILHEEPVRVRIVRPVVPRIGRLEQIERICADIQDVGICGIDGHRSNRSPRPDAIIACLPTQPPVRRLVDAVVGAGEDEIGIRWIRGQRPGEMVNRCGIGDNPRRSAVGALEDTRAIGACIDEKGIAGDRE